MSMGAQEAPRGFFKRLKQERRKRLKRFGKRLIGRLGGFIGRQSLVGDAPVLDSGHFPFLTQFTDNREPVRAEGEAASPGEPGRIRLGKNAVAGWSRRMFTRMLACFLAMMLSTAVQAQTANEPSFLKSLWSRITSAGEDAAPVESPVGSPVGSLVGSLPAPTTAPSLSSAHWIGFTPVIVADQAAGGGAWVAGPFIKAGTTSESTSGTTAWASDTVSGLTVQVRLIWREVAPGSLAELSAEAGKGLGLPPGAVANVTIYLAR